MAVHSGESRLFPEDFRQFLLYLVAAQAAGEDGSVGGEEDDFGDSVDAVKFRSNCLRVHDLRIWETTPRGLEVNKYILVAPYEIAQTGGFVVVLYSKVAEPVALLGTG